MAPEVKSLTKGNSFNARQADAYSFGMSLFLLMIGEFPNTD